MTKDTGERDENNKPKTVTVTITVTKPNSLKGRIDTWFATNAKLPAAVVAKWRKQYDVPETAVSGGHEATVGTGALEKDKTKRGPAPGGLTGDSQKAGVPGGGGHLGESLAGLPPDAKRPPPPPPPKHALGEEEQDRDGEA